MRVRVLYYKRFYPGYKIGRVYEMPNDVATEYLKDGAGEAIKRRAVETAVTPPAPEAAVEVVDLQQPRGHDPSVVPEWHLKTKSPEDYVAEHGAADPADLSPSVAKNLEIARQIVGAD